jgi:hypothetical protein
VSSCWCEKEWYVFSIQFEYDTAYTHLFIIVVKSREMLSQESVNPGLEAKERNTKPKS